MLNGLDLFSGIGGFAVALRPWVVPVAYCEISPFSQRILLSRMECGDIEPAPIWDDVRTLRSSYLPAVVDIITGGFPCQDISESGLNRGLGAQRSGLYGEIYRLAKEIKPEFLFLENVRAITSRGLDVIGEDLATLGYDCRWEVIPAYVDKSFFQGDRFFCLAKANGNRREKSGPKIRDETTFASNASAISKPLWGEDAGELARMDDGISPWAHRVLSLGNAIVPHQAREAFSRLSGMLPV